MLPRCSTRCCFFSRSKIARILEGFIRIASAISVVLPASVSLFDSPTIRHKMSPEQTRGEAHYKDVGVRIASFRSSIAHPAYPLSTLRCVPRGSSARLEAERIATRFS